MGKYSDSEDESSRRLKKKKKRRSRSRSRSVSSGDSRYSHSHSKHKKSKKKHRQRSKSRSRSSDRYSRRSPARRRRSRSSSRSRRSRSFDRGRRSKSFERSRRSRSHSRGRRSRSDSRGRTHGRRRSTSRDRGHRSRSRSQSRRSSQERRKGRRSTSPSHTPSMSESNTMDSIPGFADMTPAEQAQARLKLALRAAAAADEKLKDQSTASPLATSSPLSRQEFADAVANIESDAFVPSAFKSSRTSKAPSLKDGRDGGELSSHHMAMFGAVGSSVVFTKTEPVDRHQTALEDDPHTLFDPSLDVDPEEKMQRWIQKLSSMRRKKLEGDIMGSKY